MESCLHSPIINLNISIKKKSIPSSSCLQTISGRLFSNETSEFISYDDSTYSYWGNSLYSTSPPGSPVPNQRFLRFIDCQLSSFKFL